MSANAPASGRLRVSSVRMTAKSKRRKKKPVPVEVRLARLEERVDSLAEDAPPVLALGDVLRAYKQGGSLVPLARAIGVNPDTVYDFEKGRNRRRRFPAAVAAKVARAFAQSRVKPFGVKVTAAWLRRAWFAVPLEE